MSHAILRVITSKSDDDKSLVLVHDSLVNMPPSAEVGEYDGTHGKLWGGLGGLKLGNMTLNTRQRRCDAIMNWKPIFRWVAGCCESWLLVCQRPYRHRLWISLMAEGHGT